MLSTKLKPRYRLRYFILLFGVPAVVCYFFPLFVKDAGSGAGFSRGILETLRYFLRFAYLVAFSYFTLNLYYHLIVTRRRLGGYFKATAMIILASLAYFSLLYLAFPAEFLEKYPTLPDMLCAQMQMLIPLFILSFIFAYVTNIREALVQRRILQAQKLQLEMEKAQANLNFLKAQINPHFLHNTLNFLYSKSLPYSAELSEGILTLSDIMRYALSEGNQIDGKALLADEVEHVNNVIKINQLRFENQLQVQFRVSGNIQGASIVPFVLITLVENAFKHGDLKNPQFPMTIDLQVEGRQLHFRCRNKKKLGPKQLSTGIGLENIKKRLELSYGEKCHFTITDEGDFFTAELIIDEL